MVHTIDTDIIDKQIKQSCENYLRICNSKIDEAKELQLKYEQDPTKFTRKPDTLEELKFVYGGMIAREKEYYSLVRVIELSESKFILVYGDTDNKTVIDGTGPFESLERAISWFENGGR